MTGFRRYRVIGGLALLLMTLLPVTMLLETSAQEPSPPGDVVPLETAEPSLEPMDGVAAEPTTGPTSTSEAEPTAVEQTQGAVPTETQTPTVAPPVTTDETPAAGFLTITVLDHATGEPVSGASVQIDLIDEWRVPWENGTTDANGEFVSSEPVPAGEWEAHIAHTDYQDQTTNRFAVNGDTSITVRLQPGGGGTLTVTVTNEETGEPVSGALLEIFPTNYAGMYPPLAASGTTDVEGRWTSASELAGQQYMIAASHIDYRVALTYVWVAGDTEATVLLTPSSHGIVTITVLDEVSGEPVSGATVTLTDDGSRVDVATGITDESGIFVTEHPVPGHIYSVTATHENYFDAWGSHVEVDGPTEKVVTMDPRIAGEITVVVLDSAGKPIEGAEVAVRERSFPYSTIMNGTTDRDGRFVSEQPLTGGEYDVLAAADGYLASAEIVFVEGPTEVTVSLEPNEYRVTFTVEDQETGKPIENASVTVFNSAGYAIQSGTTDADGMFTAWKIYGEGQYSYSVTHDAFYPVDGTIDVAGKTEATAVLQPRSILAIQAIDQETGEPVAGASIMVRTDDSSEVVASGLTDDSGAFETNLVFPGESYLVEITHDDYLDAHTFVDVETLTETTLPLQPSIAGTLEILVQDRVTGDAIAIANVTIWYSGEPVSTLQTDGDGRVVFGKDTPLPAGNYWVEVHANGYFYEGDAVDITGDTEHLLTLSPNVPGVVTVRVSDGSNPVPGASISLSGGYWGTYDSATGVTDEQGVFVTSQSLGGGSYSVWVVVDGSEPLTESFYLAGDTEVIVTIETPEPVTEKPTAEPVDDARPSAPRPLDIDRLCILRPDAEGCPDSGNDQPEEKEEPSAEEDSLWDKIVPPGR